MQGNSKGQTWQYWGLDTPVLALCWAAACTDLLQITAITPVPYLMVFCLVWGIGIINQLTKTRKSSENQHSVFYRKHGILICILLVATSIFNLWALLAGTGASILTFVALPLFILVFSFLLPSCWFHQLQQLLRSIALAFLCSAPAFYFSFSLSLARQVSTTPLIYLGLLFFLHARTKDRLRTNAPRSQSYLLNWLLFILILLPTLTTNAAAPAYERQFTILIACAAAADMLYSYLSIRLPRKHALTWSWVPMTLPALLQVIFPFPF